MMYDDNLDHYFGVADSALRCITQALLAAGKDPFTVRRILDLPCGYGRVLRTLRAAFPWATLTACDLDRRAADFCAREFSAVAAYSHRDPEAIELDGDFDLIWCGSLLTHLDAPDWDRFLRLFAARLSAGGVLALTTHGRLIPLRIARGWDYGLSNGALEALLAGFREHGFGFVEYPAQPGYGISVAAPAWTLARLAERPELRLVGFSEAAWDDHQDVVACVRAPLTSPAGPAADRLAGGEATAE